MPELIVCSGLTSLANFERSSLKRGFFAPRAKRQFLHQLSSIWYKQKSQWILVGFDFDLNGDIYIS